MNESNRLKTLLGVCALLALAAIIVWKNMGPEAKPPPSAPGYYTGPMKSKGDPNLYGTDDGKRVPKPDNASSSGAAKGQAAAGPRGLDAP